SSEYDRTPGPYAIMTRDAVAAGHLDTDPRRRRGGARNPRVPEGPRTADARRQERGLDARVRHTTHGGSDHFGRPHAGARPARLRLAALRPGGRRARARAGDPGRGGHARRPDGHGALHGGAGQLGRRPLLAGRLHDRLVALRPAADHRVGSAAHGLALRRRARGAESRVSRARRLAGLHLQSRVSFTDLRAFVDHLEKHGRLKRATAAVSRDLEIAEITDRVSKSPADRNVALLFERVDGFDMPVLVNAFGAQDRMAAALGVSHLDELGERVAKLLDLKLPGTFAERLGKLGTLFDLVKAGPPRGTTAPGQEVVEPARPSLAGLPALQCWPADGGRYITLPAVFTRDPRTGQRNVGMYRLQVFDDRTLGMHWQTHKGGAEHHRVAEEQVASPDRMPVAIALGGDPALIYAASAPLPPGVDEVVFAGWLRGQGVELVRCATNDLEVPAQAEIVLEGYVDPRERRREGPFGDHTGYYSLA